MRKDVVDAPHVIGVKMAIDMMVDLIYTKVLEISDRLGAVFESAAVKHDYLTLRRDQHCSVALADVHVMNLESSIGLCKRKLTCQGSREGPESDHRLSSLTQAAAPSLRRGDGARGGTVAR